MNLHTPKVIEQRLHPRAKIRWPVTIRLSNGIMTGITLNVSCTGAFINCSDPLKPNEVFLMLIDVPTLGNLLKATAEVVWSSSYLQVDNVAPSGMGVRILNISSKNREIIAKAVAEYICGG